MIDWSMANCAGHNTDFFYANNGRESDPYMVKRLVCGECPIREACLEYALENAERWGIWGGATPKERSALMRERCGDSWRWPAEQDTIPDSYFKPFDGEENNVAS